jgi:hypothetical protein
MLSTAPSAASPVDLAREVDEVRSMRDQMSAQLFECVSLEDRKRVARGVLLADRYLAQLEEAQRSQWERRSDGPR